MRIIQARTLAEKKMSYALRYQVMGAQLGWLDTNDYPNKEETDVYDAEQAIPFLAFDDKGIPVATARIIYEGKVPLPIERFFELEPRSNTEAKHGTMSFCAEISRFISVPHTKLKNHEFTLALCNEMIRVCFAAKVSHLLLSADYRFYRLLRMLKHPVAEIGKSDFYMGSKTVPGIMSMEKWATMHGPIPASQLDTAA